MQALIAHHEQDDYTAADALGQILLGGVLGGGMHAVLGVHDPLTAERPSAAAAIAAADPAVREGAARGAIAALADGDPVDVTPLSWRPELPEPTEGAAPFERVPAEPQRLAAFLRSRGGIADDSGDFTDVVDQAGGNRQGLLRRDGMSPDEATLVAWEEGYLPSRSPGDQHPR